METPYLDKIQQPPSGFMASMQFEFLDTRSGYSESLKESEAYVAINKIGGPARRELGFILHKQNRIEKPKALGLNCLNKALRTMQTKVFYEFDVFGNNDTNNFFLKNYSKIVGNGVENYFKDFKHPESGKVEGNWDATNAVFTDLYAPYRMALREMSRCMETGETFCVGKNLSDFEFTDEEKRTDEYINAETANPEKKGNYLLKKFKEPYVTLSEIKQSGKFPDFRLVRQSRLSTMDCPQNFIDWLEKKNVL